MSQQRQARKISGKQIRIIKMAQRDIGMDDTAYRELLQSMFRVASCKDLSFAQGGLLIDELKQKGFNLKTKGRPARLRKPQPVSRDRQLQKIEALLTVGGKPWAYANALAKAICRTDDGQPIERIDWVPDSQLYKIITALRKQAQREDWDLSGE